MFEYLQKKSKLNDNYRSHVISRNFMHELEGSLYSLACFLFNNNKKDTDLVKSLVEMLPLLVISPKTCFQFENENVLH